MPPLSPAQKAYQEARGLLDSQIGLKRTPSRALELMEQANKLDPGNLTYLHLLLNLQFGARKMDDLPATAREYLAFVEKELGCPLVLVSTGPRRDETIVLKDPFAK